MNILSADSAHLVTDNLVKANILTKDRLEEAERAASDSKEPLLSVLVSKNFVTDEQLTKANADVAKIPYVNLSGAKIDPSVLTLIPKDVAERYMAVPLGEMHHKMIVAMLDAENVQAVDFLSNRIGRPLKVYAASEASIKRIIKQYDSRLDTAVADSFKVESLEPSENQNHQQNENSTTKGMVDNTQLRTLVEDSPVSKALTAILDYAAYNGASDVHIEPSEKDLRIRVRIDGVLREITRLPKSAEPAFISRIKILSNLKIDEHRVPQDGQFSIKVDKKLIDLRIAIAPIVWGEQVVIRLLDKSGTSLRLEDMGYAGRALRLIRKGLEKPNGMILTSGPTGSGKSTSMYALLQEIKDESINIVTLEDPVEYKMEGVNQIQVNPDVGLTFATGLRSVLRQDPDVIMVGEIRDKETAQLAVQAALTGHLVFSTLHTNSAAGILPRLLDMGIEPFLIASTVNVVIGQRLVRRISENNKTTYESNTAETAAIITALGGLLPKTNDDVKKVAEDLGYEKLPLANQKSYSIAKGEDTSETPGGYKGRMGLYEVFEVTEIIQNLILKKSTSSEIEKAALGEGMVNMRQDGYLKALDLKTTITEVNRVAAEGNA